MDKKIHRKSTILYVLKILQDGSDKENPISQSVITKTINLLGLKCDRKTIARDINCLIDFGYNIVKIRGGGCYYQNGDFLTEDISMMIEGILKLQISIEKKLELKKKINKLININKRVN